VLVESPVYARYRNYFFTASSDAKRDFQNSFINISSERTSRRRGMGFAPMQARLPLNGPQGDEHGGGV